MVSFGQLFWDFAIISVILFLPIMRNLIGGKPPFSGKLFSDVIINFLGVTVIHGLFFLYPDILSAGAMQLLLLVILGRFMFSVYPRIIPTWKSDFIEGQSNAEVLKRLQKALHGTMIEDTVSKEFTIRNMYLTTYTISVAEEAGRFKFLISSASSPLYAFLGIIGVYLGSSGLLNGGSDNTQVPLVQNPLELSTSVLAVIVVIILLLYGEYGRGKSLTLELPILYKDLLRKYVASTLMKGDGGDQEEYKSELEKARERARQVIESRDKDKLNRKREEIRTKVDGIFEKETPPLDDDTLRRFRLMKAVSRILQSTPPWAKVSLSEVAKLAEGEEREVELIISGLRESGEIPGIYDIWTKTYYGTKQNQWYVTELLSKALQEKGDTFVDNIKIHPDGTADLSLSKKEK